jgi:polysaccharide pyruvyl transferase WcaK-like protein
MLRSKENILILGYYNRSNIGDDCYTLAFPKIFPNSNILFKCTDDITFIPPNINIVIIGGGDVINTYFMSKVQDLLKSYIGCVYAFSVGIPYASDGLKYLHLFDHVFLRSKTDYQMAADEIGDKNVTYYPDASIVLSQPIYFNKTNKLKKIALCLAQPMFYNNPNADLILNNISEIFKQLPYQLNLLSFNYSKELCESDLLLNNKLSILLTSKKINHINHTNLSNVNDMFKVIAEMDLMICMRYHSVMFSIIKQKKYIPLYVSHKIDSLLKDYPTPYFYKLPTNTDEQPIDLDKEILTNLIHKSLYDKPIITKINIPNFKDANKLICDTHKTQNVLIKNNCDSFENILLNCKRNISHYLSITNFDELLYERKPFPLGNHNQLNVSRLISYTITKYIQNPYIWGLAQNLMNNNFCLYEAIDYIWKDMYKTKSIYNIEYYPNIEFTRKKFINLDFIFQNNFGNYHRSGWAYALGGLMNIDCTMFNRQSDLLLDTYLDRSFHWGMDTLCEIGVLPYKKPWAGIIHHTFDITHSNYNCVDLFRNKVFLESLKTCKNLITLTDYLAKQIKYALIINGFNTIPVNVIYHPMEFVPNLFTIDKFNKNAYKKIIQIGAWLRNPYSIYELPLYKTWNNPLQINKYVLKGKDMDQYFPPIDFLNIIEKVLLKDNDNNDDNISGNPISRGHISRDPISRSNNHNKYCKGLYDNIIEKINSVTVIEKVNNDEYDILLSENIVFLDLIDCSAVNTVLEILVRNTPLLVNRHPAIEEILGEKYPGFYENLNDAANILADIKKIIEITNYLKSLDKQQYKIENFVNAIQDALLFL